MHNPVKHDNVKDALRRMGGNDKMKEMQRMKQSFLMNTPLPAAGQGNIKTFDEENKQAKKGIINRVIQTQKKPPKLEDSFENLKITIKEDVLKRSCAE